MSISDSDAFLVRPFSALRPAAQHAAEVAAPPYDVMNAAEARALADGKPYSFLHVSRAEIDLPVDTDPYAEEVYTTAGANLARFEAQQVLLRDTRAGYYAYRIRNQTHSQTGIAVAASIAAYQDNRIRRHELTRPAKETDRVRQIEAVRAITGPVMLVHRSAPELDQVLDATTAAAPATLSATVAGWQHEIWPIDDPATVAAISTLMNGMNALYIADGHHRSAAAARVAASSTARCDSFLAVSFAEDAVTILDYNRVVTDLNGLEPAAFRARLGESFELETVSGPVRPQAPQQFGLYLEGRWYTLTLRTAPPAHDAVERLDVRLLDRLVLEPLLGIIDPRTDPRIDFIGGSRGVAAVAARVDGGSMAAGFTLFPTAMRDLIAVADAGRIMPPKSTWFEPKLADGLLSLPLD